MDKVFDRKVLANINRYIEANNLSVQKIAQEAGIEYHRLWSILFRSGSIKLSDYVALCKAFREPLEFFLPK